MGDGPHPSGIPWHRGDHVVTAFPEDLGGMLAGMQRIQQELEAAQAGAASASATGRSGGGAVTVRVSGEFSFDAVTIDRALVGDSDVSVLEDLVLAAVRNAVEELSAQRRSAMGGLMSGALGSLLSPDADDPDGSTD
jgi:nucleoid-associated protein EbfC